MSAAAPPTSFRLPFRIFSDTEGGGGLGVGVWKSKGLEGGGRGQDKGGEATTKSESVALN